MCKIQKNEIADTVLLKEKYQSFAGNYAINVRIKTWHMDCAVEYTCI